MAFLLPAGRGSAMLGLPHCFLTALLMHYIYTPMLPHCSLLQSMEKGLTSPPIHTASSSEVKERRS